MPIYEFRCNKCGNVFEQLTFSCDGEDKLICPSCGEGDACRLMSSFSCGPTCTSEDLNCESSSACPASPGGFS